jgi:hypothetical protein
MVKSSYQVTVLALNRIMVILAQPLVSKDRENHLQQDVENFLDHGRIPGVHSMQSFLDHLQGIIDDDNEEYPRLVNYLFP